LVRVTVNVMMSPTFGVASLTVLPIARSASWGLVEAVSLLLAGFGSNWSV
jgi:hypothetical protein